MHADPQFQINVVVPAKLTKGLLHAQRKISDFLCGRECQVLKFHHDIEGANMFPQIEAAGGGIFLEVVAKLLSEHEVVHELIIRLGRAAETLEEDPTQANFVRAATTYRKLEAVGYVSLKLTKNHQYYLHGLVKNFERLLVPRCSWYYSTSVNLT